MNSYDVSIQWSDKTKEPGYQETLEDIVVTAERMEEAIDAARASRPCVSSVKVQGATGTAIAFVGPAHYWSAKA